MICLKVLKVEFPWHQLLQTHSFKHENKTPLQLLFYQKLVLKVLPWAISWLVSSGSSISAQEAPNLELPR